MSGGAAHGLPNYVCHRQVGAILALKDRYGARLFVDDAHGVCSIGLGGRGTGVHLGVQQGIDIYFGTFAKAFAAICGFDPDEGDFQLV